MRRRGRREVIGGGGQLCPDAALPCLVRAAASEPEATRLLRELITREVFGPIAGSLGTEDARLRASFVGSQLVGLVMARYVVAVEPLASMGAEDVAQTVAPVLQRYLMEPL